MSTLPPQSVLGKQVKKYCFEIPLCLIIMDRVMKCFHIHSFRTQFKLIGRIKAAISLCSETVISNLKNNPGTTCLLSNRIEDASMHDTYQGTCYSTLNAGMPNNVY